MKSLELLQQIDAWLSFNQEPSKEEIKNLKADIKKHIAEQCATPAVIKSVCEKCKSKPSYQNSAWCIECLASQGY